MHRTDKKRIVVPLDFQGHPGVLDRFFTNVLAAAVVDLPTGLFDDPEDEHDPASRLELAAHQPDALKIQPLPFVRS